MRAARRRRRTSELGASWWVLQRVMAFSAVAEAQGSSERRYAATGKTVSLRARNPARATLGVEAGPALDVRAGDDGGFPAPPSAANQSGRRRGALAVRSRFQESVPRMTENPREDAASRRIRRAAVNPAAARMRAWASAARP